MDAFVIEGGRSLRGAVTIGGAKNAALPILAATLATDAEVTLENIPDLADVTTMRRLLSSLGSRIEPDDDTLHILPADDPSLVTAHYDLVRRMRAGICVLGPLLARRGAACVSLPGGCNIGHRPIDIHLKGLEALGASIRVIQGYVVARAHRLRGTRIDLCGPHGPTVTGTCNVLTAAALARGTTVIEHAALEPEVVDLANFLIALGANIHGHGTSTIVIDGVESLGGGYYRIIPDRIEAGTWLMAGALCGSRIELLGADASHLTSIIDWLRAIGVTIEQSGNTLMVSRSGTLQSVDYEATPHPGLPTDLQAQAMTLLSLAEGEADVIDTVFPERFMHASELCRMGADITRHPGGARVRGANTLHGTNVMASDLRASAALVLAALAAEGTTIIRRIYHLDRGYADLHGKLAALGAQVERISESPEIDAQPPAGILPNLRDLRASA